MCLGDAEMEQATTAGDRESKGQPGADAVVDDTTADSPARPANPEQPADVDTKPQYMTGWRLYMLTAGIWISLFLSTLETTIVSTSLVSIADSLSGFESRNWVVTAYFLTYTGMTRCNPRRRKYSRLKQAGSNTSKQLQDSSSSTPSWPASSGPRPCSSSPSPSLPSSRSGAGQRAA